MTSHPFILNVLQRTTTERLQRAVASITDASLTVTLTRLVDADMRGIVRTTGGKEYGVSIVGNVTTCSCPDALYRGVNCKHAIAVALTALQSPPPERVAPRTTDLTPQFPLFHLTWKSGVVLCGEHRPARVQVWPWTQGMLAWPEACPSCLHTYTHPKPALA